MLASKLTGAGLGGLAPDPRLWGCQLLTATNLSFFCSLSLGCIAQVGAVNSTLLLTAKSSRIHSSWVEAQGVQKWYFTSRVGACDIGSSCFFSLQAAHWQIGYFEIGAGLP